MLYNDSTHTLIEVITAGNTPEGEALTTEHLEELASLKGQTVGDNAFVAQVALVFILGPSDAEPWLAHIKRLGLEARVINPATAQEDVLHAGTRYEKSAANGARGTLLPVLREEGAGRIEMLVRRRLIPGPAERGPWVTFGYDTPRTLESINTTYDLTPESLEPEALVNLADQQTTIREFTRGTLAVEGEYAAESVLLLPAFSRALETRLGSKGIVVAAAAAGPVLVGPMLDMKSSMVLSAWCMDRFEKSDGRRISPSPIMVQDGIPIGFVEGVPA